MHHDMYCEWKGCQERQEESLDHNVNFTVITKINRIQVAVKRHNIQLHINPCVNL